MKWEMAGEIGVDAGLCWIGDPCYCVTPDAGNHPAKTWKEFVDILYDGEKMKRQKSGYLQHEFDKLGFKQFCYQLGHPGLGVAVSTGYGDGSYPVYVKRNSEGRIAEAKVVFIPESWEKQDG